VAELKDLRARIEDLPRGMPGLDTPPDRDVGIENRVERRKLHCAAASTSAGDGFPRFA
jgi:hypothetical protein